MFWLQHVGGKGKALYRCVNIMLPQKISIDMPKKRADKIKILEDFAEWGQTSSSFILLFQIYVHSLSSLGH